MNKPLNNAAPSQTIVSASQVRLQAQEEKLRGLLLQGLAGNSAAYHLFLKDMSAHLRGFFRRRMTNLPDDIEDLVQETLLALHNQRHTYQTHQPLTAWVQAIARYKWIDLLRARGTKEALHEPLDDDLAVFDVSELEAFATRRDLSRLLEQLPQNQRLSIIHMKIEGLSVSETAQATGMSESAVKVSVHRGLKSLAALALLKTPGVQS